MGRDGLIRIAPGQGLCLFLMLLVLCIGPAGARDLATAGVTRSNTSDDIDMYTMYAKYMNNRRLHIWPYKEEASSSWDWGVTYHRYTGSADATDFTAYQGEVLGGWRFAQWGYVAGRFGKHRLEVPDMEEQEGRSTYELDARLGPPQTFVLTLHAADDYVYQAGLQPAGVREFLHAQQHKVAIEWKPVEAVRVIASGSRWELSDDNIRQESKLNLFYGFSPGWPWIWVGVAYETLHYHENRSDYWTPREFRSLGLEFESSFPMGDDVTASLSASLSRIKEDDFQEGNSGSVFAGIDYQPHQNFIFRFGLGRIRSQQEESTWSENTYRLSFNGNF